MASIPQKTFIPLLLAVVAASALLGWQRQAPEATVSVPNPAPKPTPSAVRKRYPDLGKALTESPERFVAEVTREAEKDPASLAAWLANKTTSPNTELAVRLTAAHWAETDPQSALAWAASLSHERLRLAAFAGLYGRWTQLDATAAWKATPAEAEASAIQAWAAADFSTAEATLRNHPRVLADPTLLLSANGPVQMLGILEKLSPAQLETSGHGPWLRCLKDAPESCLKSWAKLPDSPAKEALLRSLATEWSLWDSPSLRKWLATQPEKSVQTAREILERQSG
jgi:hypothetical protein